MAPRIRSIHPGLFTDEAFMAISATARVFLIGIWCQADDRGVFEWKPLTLKACLFPADTVDTESLLSELENVDVIKRFSFNGRAYGVVRNFGRYQRPKAPKVVHPLPDELTGYAAADGTANDDGPMNYSRDVTAADRQRAKRERDNPSGGTRHGSSVTKGEESRQREEGGGRMKEGGGKKDRSANADSSTAVAADRPDPPKSQVPSKAIGAGKASAEDVTEALRCWNLLARHHGLPVAEKLTDQRKAKLRQRINDAGGIEGFKDVLRKIPKQGFLLGDNDRGWKLTIDSLVQVKTFTKIQEGSYGTGDSNHRNRNGKGAAAVITGVARAFARRDASGSGQDMEPDPEASDIEDADYRETSVH